MNRANEDALKKLTDQFNGSQSDVHVTLVNQTAYKDTFEKYVAGLSTGDLPDLVQIQDISLGQMIDTGSVLPAQACVKADHYDLSDHLKRVVDYYTVKGTLWPMPFNVSNPVFYYDQNAFTKAGLDPEQAADDARRGQGRRKEAQGRRRGVEGRLRAQDGPVVSRAVAREGGQAVREQRQWPFGAGHQGGVRQPNRAGDLLLHVGHGVERSGRGEQQPGDR